MKSLLIVLIVICFFSCTEKKTFLGKQPSYEGNALTVSELFNKKIKQTHIRITGTIYEVCKAEGCWFILQDKEQKLRCIFDNPSITMNVSNKNKRMSFEGILTDEIVDESTAREYAQQVGESTTDISGKKRIQLFVVSTILLDE
ncbi:DUF4920 domain-containing protein [bacterium]|nr:DUF4920 domain-containing protein [bacterium]